MVRRKIQRVNGSYYINIPKIHMADVMKGKRVKIKVTIDKSGATVNEDER